MNKTKTKTYLEVTVAHFITEWSCSRHRAKCSCGIILLSSQNKSVRWLLLSPFHKRGCGGPEVKSVWNNTDVDMAQNLGSELCLENRNAHRCLWVAAAYEKTWESEAQYHGYLRHAWWSHNLKTGIVWAEGSRDKELRNISWSGNFQFL